jgi:hypothetical protein
LENVQELLVTGDLHGNLVNFRKILDKASLAEHSARHLVLQELIHGSARYSPQADSSHQLLDLVAALKCQFPERVHLLLGNHELAQWKNQAIAKTEEDLNALFRSGVQTAYGIHAPDIYGAYLELFSAVPVAIRTRNRVFLSHSLPSARRIAQFSLESLLEEVCEEKCYGVGGSIHALLWGRDARASTSTDFLERMDADFLITGHIPCPGGYEFASERHLILDSSGASAGYCLFRADLPVSKSTMAQSVGTL